MAYGIRAAKIVAYEPAGAFEAQARTVDGEYRVYARFVIKAEEEDSFAGEAVHSVPDAPLEGW